MPPINTSGEFALLLSAYAQIVFDILFALGLGFVGFLLYRTMKGE